MNVFYGVSDNCALQHPAPYRYRLIFLGTKVRQRKYIRLQYGNGIVFKSDSMDNVANED